MTSTERYNERPRYSGSNHSHRHIYSPFDSESSDDSSSSSSSSDPEYCQSSQRKRRSSDRRRYAPDKSTGLTKAPPREPSSRKKPVSESRYRGQRRLNSNRSSQCDSESDTDSELTGFSSKDSSPHRHAKDDMTIGTSGYKRPRTKLEKKVDEVLDAFGLLHIKNNPSKRQLSSPDPEKYVKQKQALQAALTAAAIEAWRSHSRPGGFNLQKVIRVLAAAIAAGGVDVLVENRPGHDKMRDIAEAVVGGLATSKALGGKITHRREGGAQGTMIDGFIALAASKMVKPPKQDEIKWRKKRYATGPKRTDPSRQKRSSSRKY
ncbi:hypothetical protein TWF718_007665 [Orbilia javanica]|uniref:Uncharacterized protein n=1 Tax=Orbilia javanica TaxID=47235 RepID=A0AAN8MYJ0_9PEZI